MVKVDCLNGVEGGGGKRKLSVNMCNIVVQQMYYEIKEPCSIQFKAGAFIRIFTVCILFDRRLGRGAGLQRCECLRFGNDNTR